MIPTTAHIIANIALVITLNHGITADHKEPKAIIIGTTTNSLLTIVSNYRLLGKLLILLVVTDC